MNEELWANYTEIYKQYMGKLKNYQTNPQNLQHNQATLDLILKFSIMQTILFQVETILILCDITKSEILPEHHKGLLNNLNTVDKFLKKNGD